MQNTKIPGWKFAVLVGLVDQRTFNPVGILVPFRIQEANLRRSMSMFEDTANAMLGFYSESNANRRAVLTLHDFRDDTQNMVDLPFLLYEGLYLRVALCPNRTGFDSLEDGVVFPESECYLFPVMRLADGGYDPNAKEGQPETLTLNTIRSYQIPGETASPGGDFFWQFNQ